MQKRIDWIEEFVEEVGDILKDPATLDDYVNVVYLWHGDERMDIIHSVESMKCDCVVYNPFADDELERELDAREDDRTIRGLRSRG